MTGNFKPVDEIPNQTTQEPSLLDDRLVQEDLLG